MTDNLKSSMVLSSGGTTYLKEDGTPDVAAQKKHDDALAKAIEADKKFLAGEGVKNPPKAKNTDKT